MLNIGLMGAWHVHFKGYAAAVASRPDCRITALWDPDGQRGQKAAEAFNCEYVADMTAFCAREDIDAVVVCTETDLHYDVITAAAKAGKHIFTEKVLCFDRKSALEVQKTVEESGVKFCISYPWRCRAQYLAVKEAVRSGKLGEITYARVHNAHNGACDGWLPETFYDPVHCGGGAMMDLGAHSMYLLLDLFGDPTAVTSVFTYVTDKPVEDNAVTVLEFGGLIALSETGFVSGGFGFAMEVGGTKATMYWRGNDLILSTRADGEQPCELPEPAAMPIDQWIDAIKNNGETPFGTEDAVRLSTVMQRAYESYRGGKRVEY